MNRQPLRRLVALFIAMIVALSACSANNDGDVSIALPGREGPVVSPFITGLWPSEGAGRPNQLAAYLKWFRASGADDTPPEASGAILDPSCPLEYDYRRMATSSDEWAGNDSDALKIADVNTSAGTGYYNPARMEVLILLKGHTFDFSNGSRGNCANPDLEAYIPARLSLAQGLWQIDGWASPGSTIVVSVAQGFPMVPVKDDTNIADVRSIVSPFRLARFNVTPENFDRVLAYAYQNDNRQGYSRKILWFRQSDMSPTYARLSVNGKCKPGFYGFWSRGDDEGDSVQAACQAGAFVLTDRNANTFLDRMSRMSGNETEVWRSPDDDTCTAANAASCQQLSEGEWKSIAFQLTKLNSKDANYRGEISALKKLLENLDKSKGTNLVSAFAPPDAFGGWDQTDPNIFGIIASGGKKAMDETKDAIANGAVNQDLVGFVGQYPGADATGSVNSVTITPSFSYAEVKTDTLAASFYDKYSLLNNEGRKQFNVMAFSTSGIGASGASLPYDQSPLAQITIKVSDTFNASNASTYTTNWLPMYATGRNAGALSVRKGYDLLGDFGGAVSGAISDLLYGIYRATVGGWLAGLAQATTSNLLSLPSLDPFQVSYIRPDGSPVYALNTSLIRIDKLISWTGSGITVISTEKAGLTGDEAVCTKAAMDGKLTSPDNTVAGAGDKQLSVNVCFLQNSTYALFNVVRGFSLLLTIMLIGRYFLSLMGGGSEKRKMGLTAFFARCIFVFALILGMDTVLRVLATIVAETVLITNLIGTQAGAGTPYSHLWLFSAYLNSPSRDLNVFAMILMSPFLILGLFVLLVSNWLRFMLTYFVIGASPLWVMSLLNSARPAFFYRSLLWMIRLYLIPLLSLVVILLLFIVGRMLGIDASNAGLIEALVGMIMLILVAVIPFMLSKWLINMAAAPLQAAFNGALASIEGSKFNTALEATATGSTTDSAKEAGEARAARFESRLPTQSGAPGVTPGVSPGMDPSFMGMMPPVAAGGIGPGSAFLAAGGAAGAGGTMPAMGGWTPPNPATWGAPAPGMGVPAPGGPGMSPGGGAAPAAPFLGAPGAADIAAGRSSLKMRVLKGVGAGAVRGLASNVGLSDFIDDTKKDMRAPLALAFGKDGKPLLGSDGRQLMTPGGKPPPDIHDRIVQGLGLLTGTSVIGDGFDPKSSMGHALASIDRGMRSAESLASNSITRAKGLHEAPGLRLAISEHQAALAALETGTNALESPRLALAAAISASDKPADDPTVMGARRDLARAEEELRSKQAAARQARDKVAAVSYSAPLIGDARHVQHDQMMFEQKRHGELTQLLPAQGAATRELEANAKMLSQLAPSAGGVLDDQMNSSIAAHRTAASEIDSMRSTLIEQHQKILLMQHDYQAATAAGRPPLRLPPRSGAARP